MGTALDALKAHLAEIHNLAMVNWLLQWDQNTHMPPDGSPARAAQQSTIQRLRHELLVSDATARLLEQAAQEVDLEDFDSDDASLIRVARRDYDDASVLPSAFVAEYTTATTTAFDIWRKAKADNDWSAFMPALQRILDLKLHEAELRGYEDHVYDAFLGGWEHGLTTRQVQALFDSEKPALVELIKAVSEQQDRVDDSFLHQPFDVDTQRALARFAAEAFSVDFGAWADLAEAPHPFCLQIATGDIRITTRYNPTFFNPGFYATLHETGHGLHGRGFAPEIDGTYLSDMDAGSMAVAESQSRTWENLVGRSRAYWEWMLPQVQTFFPQQFAGVEADAMYRAVNKARPQFIRVEADELTYNLHIMLRMEIELEMVTGALPLKAVPEAWAAKFQAYFGITPPDDAQGALQDVHWSSGGIGMFVGYALGNMLAVQYYNAALRAHPSIPDQIARGDFSTLHGWLRDHIYRPGRKYTADELTRRVTGESLQTRDHVAYLEAKFKDVYAL
ncbi:MAG: carboxypeptidase M32 [Anaerolineae bacterium]|nr:carboxypeptidase M32 [Anaerolineae bacterium]